MNFSILEDGRETRADARIEGSRVLVSAVDLERAVGWSLKPAGFCREDRCIPVPKASQIVRDDVVDLEAFADLIGRPIAIDADAGAAAFGDSAAERTHAMREGAAPEFTLPDLSGRAHSLGDYRGRKALLIAWASW